MYTDLTTLSQRGTSTARAAWALALDIIRAKATDRYPSDAKRIASAVKLIHKGMVHMQTDGTAMVESRSTRQMYHVNGTCQCEAIARAADRGDTEYRCAHRWAKALYKKGMEQLTKLFCATYNETEGFAYELPETSGYAFFESSSKAGFRVITQYDAALQLHGRCAWIDNGQYVGMVPQAASDMR